MKKARPNQDQIEDLVYYLRTRIEIILNKWRVACAEDKVLNSKESFSREEFNDQIPLLLNILLQRMNGQPEAADAIAVSSEHGLHRWQSGYPLTDLVIELEHLFKIMLNEIELFDPEHTKLTSENLTLIHAELFRIYAETNRGSVTYYTELRQNAAAEQALSLQNALDQLQQSGKQRNLHLRHSSHDLRSSFGVLMMASKLLEKPSSEEERVELTKMLNTNLLAVRDMLLQLTDYAKIEAGQETLTIKKFDVATLIRDTVKAAQPLAERKQLFLKDEGPEHLEIKSDPVQITRILQNLLHNALKYTESGGIYVTWSQENESRWILSIQDTGPGFANNSPSALLADQLKPAITSTVAHHEEMPFQLAPTIEQSKNPPEMKESEGLGLFIVKKICELLKATMDIESGADKGTLIRIRLSSNQKQFKVS